MAAKRIFSALMLAVLSVSLCMAAGRVGAWSNGGYSGDPAHPDYGTHDWIAQHALDWLPPTEKQFFNDHLTSYLYGTELPDNSGTPDGVGDTTKHHIYFSASGAIADDASAVRARAEYQSAQAAYTAGNLSSAAEHLDIVAHYVGDMSVFGHVMGASTPWGAETHHSDYEDYVLTRTGAYSGGEFNAYLAFDGTLSTTSAYDAAVALARDATFDHGAAQNCTWMDQHYNWSDPTFKGRCGESLSLAVNAVADVMHTFLQQTIIPEFPRAKIICALVFSLVSLTATIVLKANRHKRT